MGSETRERILETALLHVARHGYEGAAIKPIARDAGAALGSLYHFFPGGKLELVLEAVALSERRFTALLEAALAQPDAREAIVACFAAVADDLRGSDWVDACSFSALALGAAPDVEAAVAAAVTRWRELVAARLAAADVPDAEALASTIVATLEGASLAARIARSTEPLELAGAQLARLVRPRD